MAEVQEIRFRATADSKQMLAELNAVGSKIEDVNKGFATTGNRVASATARMSQQQGIINQLKALEADLEKQRNKSNDPKKIDEYNKKLAQTRNQLNQLTASAKQTDKAVSTMGNTMKSVGIAIAAAFSFQAIKGFAMEVIKITAAFQKYEAVLTNALGSQTRAMLAMKQIQDFAAQTPFSVNELTESFVKLANRGIALTVPQMRKLGDTASALGKPFEQVVEAILDVNNTERWTEIGIKAKTAGDKVRLTFKGVTQEVARSEAGVLSAIEAFGSMNTVAGTSAAVAKTLEGQLSNLGDNFDSLKVEIGNNLNPIFTEFISLLNEAITGGKDLIKYFKDLFSGTAESTKALQAMLRIFVPLLAILNLFIIRLVVLKTAQLGLAVATRTYAAAQMLANRYTEIAAIRTAALTVASRAAALAQRGLSAASNLLAGIFVQFPGIFGAATKAMSAMNLVSRNLAGGLALGVAAAGALIAAVNVLGGAAKINNNALDKVTASVKAIKDAAAPTITAMDELISRLNSTNVPSARADILAEINELLQQEIKSATDLNRLQLDQNATLDQTKNFSEDFNNALLKRIALENQSKQLSDDKAKSLELQNTIAGRYPDEAERINLLRQQIIEQKRIIQQSENIAVKLKTEENAQRDINDQIERGRVGVGYGNSVDELNKKLAESKKRQTELLAQKDLIDPKAVATAQVELGKLGKELFDTFKTLPDFGRFLGNIFGLTAAETADLAGEIIALDERLKENRLVTNAVVADVLTYDKTLKSVAGGKGTVRKASDEFELFTEIIIADTTAIEAHILAMRAEIKELEYRAEILSRMNRGEVFNPLAIDIEEIRHDTDLIREEAKERNRVAIDNLSTDYNTEEKAFIARRDALRKRLAEEQGKTDSKGVSTTDPETVANLQRLLSNENVDKQLLNLETNYWNERNRIAERYSEDQIEIETDMYARQIDAAKKFYAEELELIKAANAEILAQNQEIADTILMDDISNNEDRLAEIVAANERVKVAETVAADARIANIVRQNERVKMAEIETRKDIAAQVAAAEAEIAKAQANIKAPGATDLQKNAANEQIAAQEKLLKDLELQKVKSDQRLLLQQTITERKLREEEQKSLDARLAARKKYEEHYQKLLQSELDSLVKMADLVDSIVNNPNLFNVRRRGEFAFLQGITLALQNAVTLWKKYSFEFKKFAETEEGQRLAQLKRENDAIVNAYKARIAAGEELNNEEKVNYDKALSQQNDIGKATVDAEKKYQIQRKVQIANFVGDVGNLLGETLNKILQDSIDLQTQQINVTQQHVDTIRGALQAGGEAAKEYSATVLQAEEERLERQKKMRQKDVQNQQIIAAIQLVLNSAIAISKAAAEGGVAAPITIAITLASLAVGLALARSQADSFAGSIPQAERGGVAGEGKLVNAKKGGVLQGRRHSEGGIIIEAEHGERIFDRQKSMQFKPLFDAIAANKYSPTLPPGVKYDGVKSVESHLSLRNEFKELSDNVNQIATVMSKMKMEAHIDGKGLHAIVTGVETAKIRNQKRFSRETKV